jgi:cbb3-type cytochrome oxidase subunit 3
MNQIIILIILFFLSSFLIVLNIKNRKIKQKDKNRNLIISDEVAEAMANKIKFESKQHRTKK